MYGMLLESRPGRSSYPSSAEVSPSRILCRHILIQAVHDLGCGGQREQEDVTDFLKTKWFLVLCEFSEWDDSWVRELFFSIGMLRDGVRKEMTRQVTHMMKAIAEVGLD